MKLPMTSSLLTEARLYALESTQFTFDYDGWNQQNEASAAAKLERITIGRYGQLWLAEFCKINGIPYEKDLSSPFVTDTSDIFIAGRSVDVKTSKMSNLPPQVSPGVVSKSEVFAFLRTDQSLSFIEPLGFIESDAFLQLARKILYDDLIPGTTFRQRFKEGSYFIEPRHLTPFGRVVRELMKSKSWRKPEYVKGGLA